MHHKVLWSKLQEALYTRVVNDLVCVCLDRSWTNSTGSSFNASGLSENILGFPNFRFQQYWQSFILNPLTTPHALTCQWLATSYCVLDPALWIDHKECSWANWYLDIDHHQIIVRKFLHSCICGLSIESFVPLRIHSDHICTVSVKARSHASFEHPDNPYTMICHQLEQYGPGSALK